MALVTGGQGEIRNSYQYDAFGIPLETTEKLNNRIRYTGQQNLYAYCGNNPVVYDDPSGYTGTSIGKACPPQGKINESVDESGTSSIGRMDLAGKTHPVSGVKFDSNGFPIFESKYDTKLEPQDYLKSRGTHFAKASEALYNDIMNDSNLRSKFTEAEIAIFKEGGVPKAYTWHHQDEGVMQLVDRKIHRQTRHTGGFSIWGSGN